MTRLVALANSLTYRNDRYIICNGKAFETPPFFGLLQNDLLDTIIFY
jgi:hypothetical protein